ncbi:FG-GAP-like repeat-containing protein [Streptomyces sp. NPDC089799]|uniref:FG-GAP-like repeat-containing protein n=1 Tax=Streptomyces sp. NPDC089799 TaxID=3155066 RepID=UPI003424D750
MRKTLVAAVVVAATATALPLTVGTGTAVAAAPAEYVIPARQLPDPAAAPVAATAGGFLRKGATAGAYTWTAYGSNEAEQVGPFPGTPHQAGAHTIAFVQTGGTTAVTFRDLRDGTAKTLTLPAGRTFRAVVGERVLATDSAASGTVDLHWLTLEGGVVVDRPGGRVPGSSLVEVRGANQHGALLQTADSEGLRFSWVTPDGKVREEDGFSALKVVGDRLFATDRDDDTSVRWFKVWDAKGSLDPGAAQQVNEAYPDSGGRLVGVVGGEALQLAADGRLFALPLDGGAPRVLAEGVTTATASPGGTVVATGPQPGNTHAVHAVVPGGDGRAVVRRSDIAPAAQRIARIAMDNGRVHTLDTHPLQDHVLSMYTMAPGGQPQAGTWRTRSSTVWQMREYFPDACRTSASCPDLLAVGEGQLLIDSPRTQFLRMQIKTDTGTPHTNLPKAPGTLQGSGQYAAYLAPDRKSVSTFNLFTQQIGPVSIPVSDGRFALSGSWVWRQKSAGALEAVDVRTGAVVRSATVADCDVKSLEAWASSVYWKCDGASGVYDTGTKENVPLPAHNSARLGNGFVVWEKDGALNSTALRGTSGTRQIGKPASARPGEGWTVDRQSGRIGWVDGGQAVHVVDAGVPAVAVSSYDRNTPAVAAAPGKDEWLGWRAAWWLNHPVTSWKFTLARKSDGVVVRTFTGGEARGDIGLVWNGKDDAGHVLPSGEYVSLLTAQPAVAGAAPLKAAGTLTFDSGVDLRRDHTGRDGFGDLATLDAKGVLTFHGGDGKGGLGGPKVSGAGWPTTSTVIPFGDVNGGRCNDVLVRNAAGTLRAYQPGCGVAVSPTTGNKWLGTGFNAYDVLTSAGDVTGDGRADLLGRQASTGDLYLFAHDGKGGLAPGVKVSGGWKSYKQVVGAGDLNGDGHGDVLAVDGANTLWRFDGTGKGTFKARVQVNGAGWAAGRVQLIGIGDISGDGRADVVSRNAAGELLRNSGDGKGGLQATVKIATGFGGYKGVF